MNKKTNKLVKSGIFLALGLIVPYTFHMVGFAGQVFLPMHIPVLLCGLLLGAQYGFTVGLMTPLLSSLLTGMPPIYPVGVSMTFELAAYGMISGVIYKKTRLNIYISLILAMLAGRLVSGTVNYILLSGTENPYVLKMFLTSAFIKPVWGIIIQVVLIPIIVKLSEKSQR
ncbi:MAG: ECF transporter S component [Bacillota bacterium]